MGSAEGTRAMAGLTAAGAAAVPLADADRARSLGLRPRARILAQCLAGAEPY